MAKKQEKKPRSQYTKKMWMAALVMLAASLVLVFVGPFESLAFAGNAMSYTHREVWHLLLFAALAFFAAGTFLLPLLKGKAFRYSITAVFALTLCGYLQSVLMNSSLGLMDGTALSISPVWMVLNLLIWAALFAGCYVVLHLSRRIWRTVLRFGSVLLAVMQLASVFSIALGNAAPAPEMGNYCLTEDGMYEYSSKENIFVFVLDRLDYAYLEGVLKEDPEFFDGMDGFTWYTNAISAYGRTQPALNHLLTGSETAFTVPKNDFYANSWHEDGKAILEDLDKLGYSSRFYTNIRYLFSDPEYALRYADNAAPTNVLRPGVVLPKLLRLSAYRWSPMILKNLFWEDTDYYNADVYNENGQAPYEANDSHYGPGFLNATANRQEKSFQFYHFTGSHAPYTMKADGTHSDKDTTVTEQTMGCFLHVFGAIERMKELGIYEDATIIITADHGSAYKDSEPLLKKVTIGLFYKPAGSAGTPLAYSKAPVTTDNIGATIVKAAGLSDGSAYGPALDEVPEDADITRYYYKSVAEKETWHEVSVYRYAVVGDANDFANWTLVDVFEPVPEENRFY